MRKVVDFGNGAGNCFDFEGTVRGMGVLDDGTGTIIAQPVFIVDPCQSGLSPLKTATLLPVQQTLQAGGQTVALAIYLNTYAAQLGISNSLFLEAQMLIGFRQVSAANSTNTYTLDVRNLNKSIAISSIASGGTSTLLVESSTDNSNYITIDSIAAALSNVKQYTETTVGAGVALSPLSFRYLRVTAGAAGVGNTTTLITAMK
jgi:hypothetical protein